MGVATEGVLRRNVCVSLDEETYKLFRGILFKTSVTMQDFVNYVIETGVKQDKRVMTLLKETSLKRSQSDVADFLQGKKTSTTNEIYNLIDQRTALNQQKKVEDNNVNEENDCWYDEKGNVITWRNQPEE